MIHECFLHSNTYLCHCTNVFVFQEKIDKEKDDKEKESPIEEKRFETSGIDRDLVDMLGT